ncbi:MAG: hypothetical protein ACM3H7_02335 [Acidobacteriaceae bacterium]
MADRNLIELCKAVLRSPACFCHDAGGLRLRSYQVQVAEAVIKSVLKESGFSFVVIFPRQSGKNELQAQIEAYLLALSSHQPAEMIKVSPTWKPQSLNAMRRLERVLKRNLITRASWEKRSGYFYQVGQAMIYFLSGAPTSSIVGATASLLLECDEAQDVQISKWDKEIAPMAASTNATRVFWGTAWTSKTLLARELRAARLAEKKDGIRRTWVMTADQVGEEVPAYASYVQEQVEKLGRNNPLIKTQYFSEEIDAEGGMFPLTRRVLMVGAHSKRLAPEKGRIYAFTIDVAGEDEGAIADLEQLSNPRRDSTVLTIFELEIPSTNHVVGRPIYKVVCRLSWVGVKHSSLYTQLVDLASSWQPVKLIIDATGVGAGLASFLVDRLGSKVIPFEFTQLSKSDLGWAFISVIETGRFKDYTPQDEDFCRQLEYCQYEIMEGPQKTMRWSVPDGTRDVATGELVHDDQVLSAALISLLDQEPWGTGESQVVKQKDILEELSF